jgi:hypothetical protein
MIKKKYFKVIRLTVFFVGSFLLLFYLTRNYSLTGLKQVFVNLNLGLVFMGFLAKAMLYLLSGLRWHYLFPVYPFLASVHGTIVAISANFIIPVRGGEVIRAIYMGKKNDVNITETLSRIVVERFFDAFSVFSFLFLAIIFFGNVLGNDANRVFYAGITLICLFIVMVLVYIKFSDHVNKHLKNIAALLLIPKNLIQKGKSFLSIYKQLTIRKIIWPFFITFSISFSEILSMLFFLNACGIAIKLHQAIIIFPLIILSISIPVAVGHIGVYHAAMICALSFVGFSGEEMIGKVIVVHLLSIVPVAVYGWTLIFQQKLNVLIK